VVGIRRIDIGYGNQIDFMKVVYVLANRSHYRASGHGNNNKSSNNNGGGSRYFTAITLRDDERIVQVEGSTGAFGLSHLTITVKGSNHTQQTHGPFGRLGPNPFQVEGYILGFKGRESSSMVTGLSIYYLAPFNKSAAAFGCTGTNYPFDDDIDAIIPPVVGLKSVKIRHWDLIDGIQSTFVLLDGSLHEGILHGGEGGHVTVVQIRNSEQLVRITGRPFFHYLGTLSLYSNFRGNTSQHGSFGILHQEETFELSGNIMGFFGWSQHYPAVARPVVAKIGVYTV